MTKLEWGDSASRFFEAGCDRGVFYPPGGSGVAWPGLISVDQTPTGGSSTGYYLDGIRHLTETDVEEFAAKLTAFMYPEEFEPFDGYANTGRGLILGQQGRKAFHLTYRTGVGNGLEGIDHAYKIHVIYNAVAAPTNRTHVTLSDSTNPLSFSWDLSTKPVSFPGYRPTAHYAIDSRTTDPRILRIVEDYLYGTEKSSATMLSPTQWFELTEANGYEIIDSQTGLSPVIASDVLDLYGSGDGLNRATPNTRLVETDIPGFYTMEN